MTFSPQNNRWMEPARWLALLAAGCWLLHPFLTTRMVGTGDAVWYANMLADFVTQLRAGTFPIFAGQTEFAFNGAVYPLRVAPYFQHLCGLIDLLTGRQLGFFTLQHATVVLSGLAGLFSAYACVRAVQPDRPWRAAGFAVLYLSCPGVLGTIYTQDLYMTWMTVPFMPVVFYATVRAWQRDDWPAQLMLAGGLGALWWCHTPVALWTTLLIGALQLIRLLSIHRRPGSWKKAVGGGLLLALLGHYPFVSVASLQSPNAASVVSAGLPESERITNVIRDVFPAVLLPLSKQANALSDLQLGYGLWSILGCCLVAAAVTRNRMLLGLVGAAALILVLLLPVPFLNSWLWLHLPEEIKRITFYWPMHRFYLILAALLTIAGPLAFAGWRHRRQDRMDFLTILMLLAVGWSLWESRQFVAAGRERTGSREKSEQAMCPENHLLMNHAYGLFPALPAYFSNGVMDPRAETRLLAQDTLLPLPVPETGTSPDVPLQGVAGNNPGVLRLSPTLQLEPGRRYRLEFEFNHNAAAGVLQLSGKSFFREYSLPESGRALAFGSKPGTPHTLTLWTTSSAPEEIRIRFIPVDGQPLRYADFGRMRLRAIDALNEPVELESLLPFRAKVRTAQSGWLETPRMFIPGYSATVDGKPVEAKRSPQGLVMIGIQPSTRDVSLAYVGPRALHVSYWLSLAAWAILLPVAAVVIFRTRADAVRAEAA